jgi:hypothetical protein
MYFFSLKPVRPVHYRFRFRLDPRPVPVLVSVFKTLVKTTILIAKYDIAEMSIFVIFELMG